MKKYVYYNEWTVRFDGTKEQEELLKTCALREEDALKLGSSFNHCCVNRAEFINGQISKIEAIECGEIGEDRKLEESEIGYRYKDFSPKSIYFLITHSKGQHYLGGSPNDVHIVLPSHPRMNTTFQYLGCISRNDKVFHWLPMDQLHVVFPLYSWAEKIFLDYSDPLKPQIIPTEDLKLIINSFDYLDKNSKIEFERTPFQCVSLESIPLKSEMGNVCYSGEDQRMEYKEIISLDIKGKIGSAGVPQWCQHPVIPTCPRSGRKMKFVLQITDADIKTANSNIKSPKEYDERHVFSKMMDGEIYIFMETAEKTVCIFYQTT